MKFLTVRVSAIYLEHINRTTVSTCLTISFLYLVSFFVCCVSLTRLFFTFVLSTNHASTKECCRLKSEHRYSVCIVCGYNIIWYAGLLCVSDVQNLVLQPRKLSNRLSSYTMKQQSCESWIVSYSTLTYTLLAPVTLTMT